MNTSTTTPAGAPTGAPSTDQPRAIPLRAKVGDILLVKIDDQGVAGTWRPMVVTSCGVHGFHRRVTPTTAANPEIKSFRVSGTIFCEAEDHTRTLFRGWGYQDDPARVAGRPDRSFPFGYAEHLQEGEGIGNWRLKDTLPLGRSQGSPAGGKG